MRKVIVCAAVIAMFAVPAICAQNSGLKTEQKAKMQEQKAAQKAENQKFRDSLKGMTKEQRAEAIKKHRDMQKQENMMFRKDLYVQNKAYLEQKLAGNKKLTQAQKDELIKLYDENHTAKMEHRESQYQENADLISKIANDPSLTQAQKRIAIKEHFKQQKAENAKFREEMKAKAKAAKGSIKPSPEQPSNPEQ